MDEKLDDKPTVARVRRIVELRIRNILAFRELAEYNAKGKYLFRHPLIRQYTERMQLIELLKSKPSDFLEEYGNCKNNITRYSSYLNRKNIPPQQEQKWRENLLKHEERLQLITEILQYGNNQCLQSQRDANGGVE